MKKKNDKWRMCVDYTDLNKSCPSDPFALPRMDQLVDSMASCDLYSFLDAYLGYHQISLKESDCIYTSFTTPFGVYCYVSMPFGLKNAEATYQCCIQRCLHKQIGINAKAYVDDIVVTSRTRNDLLVDPQETYDNLREYHMKLNPEKCLRRTIREVVGIYYLSTWH